MKVYKKGDKIIFEVPFWSKRSNPYMPDDVDVGEHKTLVGVIRNDDCSNQELGFALIIDMDYKGKGDQETDIMIHCWDEDKKGFIELCGKLGIEVLEYPICAYCEKTIYGCYTTGKKGDMCSECEQKLEKS